MIRAGCLFLAALILATPAGAQAPAGVRSVTAEGTQFRLTLTDGREVRSPDLAGAVLMLDTPSGPAKIRVETVERDPDAKSGDVWLHTLLVEDPDGSTHNMCEPGPDGRRQAFPIATRQRAGGGFDATAPEQFDLVCTGGARAKCVRFGYRPWVSAEMPAYNACVRMVRADYCGLGEGTTRTGMRIDLYDDNKIQTPDNDPAQAFEAGWTEDGAVCVHHPRVRENITLQALEAACPRLAGKTGAMCTETTARAMGARLFNRSTP